MVLVFRCFFFFLIPPPTYFPPTLAHLGDPEVSVVTKVPWQGSDPLPPPHPRILQSPVKLDTVRASMQGAEGPGKREVESLSPVGRLLQEPGVWNELSLLFLSEAGSCWKQGHSSPSPESGGEAAICWALVRGCADESQRLPGVGGHPASTDGSGFLRRMADLMVSGPDTI